MPLDDAANITTVVAHEGNWGLREEAAAMEKNRADSVALEARARWRPAQEVEREEQGVQPDVADDHVACAPTLQPFLTSMRGGRGGRGGGGGASMVLGWV
jgi:hypothetical protein